MFKGISIILSLVVVGTHSEAHQVLRDRNSLSGCEYTCSARCVRQARQVLHGCGDQGRKKRPGRGHYSECMETVNDLGFTFSHQIRSMCEGASGEASRCYSVLKRAGVSFQSALENLCKRANRRQVECFQSAADMGKWMEWQFSELCLR